MEIKLDTNITPELRTEGIKRELIHLINIERKNNNLSINNVCNISIYGDDEVNQTIEENKQLLEKETLSVITVVENDGNEKGFDVYKEGDKLEKNNKLINLTTKL